MCDVTRKVWIRLIFILIRFLLLMQTRPNSFEDGTDNRNQNKSVSFVIFTTGNANFNFCIVGSKQILRR